MELFAAIAMLFGTILLLLYSYYMFRFMFWLCVSVPMEMAELRGRDRVAWLFVSLICSPMLAIPLLWILGDVEG